MNLLKFVILFGILLDAVNGLRRVKRIVGGRAAAAPPPDDPVIFARMYNRDARVEGFRSEKSSLYSFLGLRYADAPIGVLRFARPQYKRLEGDINATKYGPPCPQPNPQNLRQIVGNEDCLLLNIYTPRMPDESVGLPVYVWIHGGGFRYGSAAQYGAEPLTEKGVVLVAIQYRLGSLGIIGENSKNFSGNLAMFDMTAALRWVTEYISFFGGNPKQIKVIGQGSGAASAMYLTMSRIPRNSISGVVSMSGSALSQYALDDKPTQSVEEIAGIHKCPSTNETEIVNCLREKAVEDIIRMDSAIQTERLQGRAMVEGIAGGVGFRPHQEDADDQRALPGFITDNPQQILQNEDINKVPLLIGVTKHETRNGLSLNIISNIWGSLSAFLSSLLNNLSNLKGLIKIDEITGKLLDPILPGLGNFDLNLEKYLTISDELNAEQILDKLTETTTDVLFNLPAVLSANIWGRVAPAFLYSFEYAGNKSRGINFLRGLPIVTEQGEDDFVSHGDELGYIFDANDIFGNPIIEARLDTQDLKVRDIFTNLLAKFAHIDGSSEYKGDSIFRPFDSKGAPFIKITDQIESAVDFRFCELSLWGAPIESIKTTTCSFLMKNLGSIIQDPVGNVGGTLTNIVNPIIANETSRIVPSIIPSISLIGSGGLFG